MSNTFNKTTPVKGAKKKALGGVLLATLTLGGGATSVAMLNVAHAAEVTAAATAQARTEKTVSLTAQDFTAYAPSETFQNYVNWTLKTDKLPQRSDASRTVYTVDVAKLLEGINFDKSSLKIGLGAMPGSTLGELEKGGDFPFPMYVKDEAAEPRQGALPYGATTITANADGTITIPRDDDSRQTISFLYSVKDGNGDLITQRITIAPTLPKVAPGTVNASTTIGELGTTNGNPTTVKAGANGEVTFTYTNNSEIVATTAPRASITDEKIYVSLTRDGQAVTLPEIEIAPGETKTISVNTVSASITPEEVTGAEFTVKEELPGFAGVIAVAPCDNLSATPFILDVTGQGQSGSYNDFKDMFFSGKETKKAPVVPAGVNVVDTPILADAADYTMGLGANSGYSGSCPAFLDVISTGRTTPSTNASGWYVQDVTSKTYDYSVYVKPVAAPEPTPEPTPTETPAPTPTPDVTPEPTPSETPVPVPSESTPPAPVEPSPSTPAEPTPSVTPTPEPTPTSPVAVPTVDPTPTATSPVPSVSPSEPAVEKPSEPGVKPSEPAKPVEAKTGHEQGSGVPVAGIIGGIAGLVVVAAGGFFLWKRRHS